MSRIIYTARHVQGWCHALTTHLWGQDFHVKDFSHTGMRPYACRFLLLVCRRVHCSACVQGCLLRLMSKQKEVFTLHLSCDWLALTCACLFAVAMAIEWFDFTPGMGLEHTLCCLIIFLSGSLMYTSQLALFLYTFTFFEENTVVIYILDDYTHSSTISIVRLSLDYVGITLVATIGHYDALN